jgi:hypothetical protein
MSEISEIVRELRDNYPAVDVTTVIFGEEFCGVGCCVIPQDRVLAIIGLLEGLEVRVAPCQCCSQVRPLRCGPSRFGKETWACDECWVDAPVDGHVGQTRGSSS